MKLCKGLLILGFGGHARSVADVALAAGIQNVLFVDANAKDGEHFMGFPVQREYLQQLPEDWLCLPASGHNQRRKLQVELAQKREWPLATLIAPTATIGVGTAIAPGCFIAQHAHVGPMTKIDIGSLINTGAIVEHDCAIGSYVHISVHATVAGNCHIGDCSFVCAGATIINNITIGHEITIGAGSVVVTDLQQPGIYIGAPARLMNNQ